MKNRFVRISAAAMALAVAAVGWGCGKKYWVPTPEQLGAAGEIAKLAVLQHVSDQKDDAPVREMTYTPGQPVEPPVVFTIRDVPFSRYRSKMWGRNVNGRPLVIVVYADPFRIPDWETSEALDGFPARIVVAVDVTAGRPAMPVPFDATALK